MDNFDAIIIGSGMTGASVAFELAKHANVLLLERESATGYHSTGRSAAVYIPTYGFDQLPLRVLSVCSYDFLNKPPRGFCSEPLLRERGLLWISDEASKDQLETKFSAMQDAEIPVQWVDHVSLSKLTPGLAKNYSSCAIYDPAVADIDVHELHNSYLKGLIAQKGRLEKNIQIRSIERSKDEWTVSSKNARFRAPILVNAAGAWVDEVAEIAGVEPIGISPLRRTAVLLDAPSQIDFDSYPVIADINYQFYFKPEAGLVLVSPSDESPTPPCDAQAEEIDIAHAVQYAEKAFGIHVEKVHSSWAGLRSFVSDRLPVIGFDRAFPGFFWLAGQGGHGIQTAPAQSRLAANLLLNEDLPEDIKEMGLSKEMVSPDRIINRTKYVGEELQI